MSTLNEEILRLKNAKAAIDEVLIARGVSIPENATLDTYNELINSIQGGTSSEEVTAIKANVLAGTTTITADSNDEIVEGTMPNNSGQAKGTDNVYFDDSYMHVTVKYPGYYDENSTIRINKSNLGDATVDKVLEGTTYSSSEGLNLSGNIPIKSADTYFASTNDLTIDAGQYLGGTQTIKGLAQTNFSPANIKTGVTVKINNGDRDLFSATGTFCNDATLASAANLLTGNIAYGKDGTKYTGSMPNNGAVAPSALGAGGSYTIPAGYHNGSGKVIVQTLATMTASGDATAAQILSGKKAYVDGSLITGSMADQGAKTSSLNCGGSYTIPAGYHNGSGKITANSLASQTDATATAAYIRSGYTAWVKGSKLTGSMAVTSAINFKATTQSATVIRISWTNPSIGPWEGVFIQMSTSGNPGVSGGTRAYTGRGNSTTAGGSNYIDITGLTPGTTYYFTCTSYASGLGNGSSYNVNAKTKGVVLFWDGSTPYSWDGVTISGGYMQPNGNVRASYEGSIHLARLTSGTTIDISGCPKLNIILIDSSSTESSYWLHSVHLYNLTTRTRYAEYFNYSRPDDMKGKERTLSYDFSVSGNDYWELFTGTAAKTVRFGIAFGGNSSSESFRGDWAITSPRIKRMWFE